MRSIISLLFLLLCTTSFAFQIPFGKTENPNVLKKKVLYDDGVVAWERFYNQNKKLDSSKTYYKSGVLDELFYFDKGFYDGISYKFNSVGDTITTWQFNHGSLVERKDIQLVYTQKTEKKVKEYVERLIGLNEKAKQNPNDLRLQYNITRTRLYLQNKTLGFDGLKRIEKHFNKKQKKKEIPEKIWGSIYDNLGNIYSSYEMEDYAIRYRFKALIASPKESRLHYNIGAYLVATKHYRLGITFLKKAIDMVPGHSFAHWALAIAYSDLGRYEEAMQAVNVAFKNEDNLYKKGNGVDERDLNTIRGLLHHKLGNTQAGIIDLQKALSINPNNSFALKNLGIIYLDIEKFEDACALFTKAESLHYKKVHDNDDLESLLKLACNHKESLFALKTSLEQEPYVFPNPVKDIVNIKNFELTNFNYEIYSFDSRLISKGTSNASGIDVSSLSRDFYILKIEKEGIRYSFKIIKD